MTPFLLAVAIAAQQLDSNSVARAAERILGASREGLAAAALVVVQGDRTVLLRGYGSAGRSGPVDPERTLFRTASVGKLFVATAAMQLAQGGKLDLDRDIADYLPELELRRRGWPKVTMRQLLSHTGGVEDAFMGTIERVGRAPTGLDEHFRQRLPNVAAPGEQVNYSNLGVALGALVLERIAGVPFADYVTTHIFAPLGMRQSTYSEPLPPSARANLTGDSSMARYRLIPYPAGSLVTSAADMGRFIGMQLDSGALGTPRILDSAALTKMHTRVWSAHPAMPGVALGFFESELGGERLLFHTGSRGHYSALVLVPERRIGFYMVLDAREGLSAGIIDELTQALLGARWQSRADTTAAAPSADYVGRYRLNAGPRHSFENVAKLAIGDVVVSGDARGLILNRGRPMRLWRLDRDLFQTSGGMFVAFHRTRDGSVDRMHASGRLMDGVSLDRLAIWESSTLHRAALGVSFVLALLVTMSRTLSALWRRISRRSSRATAWPRRVTRGATALYAIAPLPVLVVALTAADPTVVELTPAVSGARAIVGVATILALGGTLAIALGLGGSRPYLIRDAVYALIVVVATAVLGYWRVLPLLG